MPGRIEPIRLYLDHVDDADLAEAAEALALTETAENPTR